VQVVQEFIERRAQADSLVVRGQNNRETAGGAVEMKPRTDMKEKYSIVASNGVIDLKLQRA